MLTTKSRSLFLQKNSIVDVRLGSKYASDIFEWLSKKLLLVEYKSKFFENVQIWGHIAVTYLAKNLRLKFNPLFCFSRFITSIQKKYALSIIGQCGADDI